MSRARSAAPALTVGADLWLDLGGQNLAGARRVALLSEIARVGSITQAAKVVGLSYKGAWNAIEDMSNLAGEPLLERAAGGKGGGFTRLTPRGEKLVRNFELVRDEHARFVARLNRQARGLTDDYALMESIAMKTSARNQFAGVVRAVRSGAINDEIELQVIGRLNIVATVTRESRTELGLEVGAKAFALIKASSILLMTDAGEVRLSARNQLAGTVTRVLPGAVNTEVVLSLPGGGSVAAVVTNTSADALGLTIGAAATAVFKASSVILGVAA
ncbi:TOBE domain-containing protein [Rhizobacter sp. Root404]|uniref:TOBE domain-containing protein n=1 Tax=Rhizobacter sp. Root404 TaxID=1736528 RepID=UPI0006F27DD0|nr:TOBE domain-containing protein [Rhizobacter sp. Root404]KQW35611.1 molybdenum-dependent transcriptional regulator [Rhizobacter sp. Root404]